MKRGLAAVAAIMATAVSCGPELGEACRNEGQVATDSDNRVYECRISPGEVTRNAVGKKFPVYRWFEKK